MRLAVCPGSFDPVTLGHLDIISRAARLFDKVIVLVSFNPYKSNYSFTPEERMDLARRATAHLPNVTVDCDDGLLAEYVKKKQACAIVKGLRAVSDFEYEFQMSLANKKMFPGAETIFFTTDAGNMYLSSSLVKNIASLGGDISDFVPGCILEDIQQRLFPKQR